MNDQNLGKSPCSLCAFEEEPEIPAVVMGFGCVIEGGQAHGLLGALGRQHFSLLLSFLRCHLYHSKSLVYLYFFHNKCPAYFLLYSHCSQPHKAACLPSSLGASADKNSPPPQADSSPLPSPQVAFSSKADLVTRSVSHLGRGVLGARTGLLSVPQVLTLRPPSTLESSLSTKCR